MESKSLICIELLGGLGNQLFQYAAGVAISKKYNIALLIVKEKDNAHNINNNDYREILMEGYNIDNEINPNHFMGGMPVYNQKSGFEEWNPRMFESVIKQTPVLIRGYFQYLPAIESVLPEIIRDINNKLEKYKEEMKKKYNLTEKSVFLHVRRGDYVGKPDYHYLQREEYYKEAYHYIKPEDKVYILSDDIKWCREQEWIKQIKDGVIIDENEDEINTLAIMTECKGGAIMANSTFSWWGAELSEGKKIVYPSRWINEKVYDLFPKEWKCI